MSTITRIQKRISGPLLDRIEIHSSVQPVEYEQLADDRLGEASAAIRARVEAARERRWERRVGAARARRKDDRESAADRQEARLDLTNPLTDPMSRGISDWH